jgi:phenylalanyl-tRNA synthetase alpha chain
LSLQFAEEELKELLTGLAKHLFGDVEMRWREDYFPFTEPSFELEVLFQEQWLEVLGCGVVHPEVLQAAGLRPEEVEGWAFGLGLERLAMVLFGIPDIRLFWSSDERFVKQFRTGQLSRFVPYSKYPLCYKDVSFWLPQEESAGRPTYHENEVFDVSYRSANKRPKGRRHLFFCFVCH